MLYLIGALLAAVPLLVWGWIFYRKDPARKDLIILSFSAGVLSVVPIYLVLGIFGESPLSFGNISLGGFNLYEVVADLSNSGGASQLGIYILTSILAFFFMYLIIGVIMFLIDVIAGEQTIQSYEKILKRSLEAPFLFITLGIAVGVISFLFDWSLDVVMYKSLLVGGVEEFSKHLVLRFSDENKFRTINDAIEFSIMVALGFAFLENITYFVDNVWLMCDSEARSLGMCIQDADTGRWIFNFESNTIANPGRVLQPFIGRSLLSTLTHIVSSGLFGYFYGLAHFSQDTITSYAKQPKKLHTRILAILHKIFHLKGTTLLREEKLLEGAMLAMVFHGVFNFLVDGSTSKASVELIGVSSVVIAVPMLFIGAGVLFWLFSKPENSIVWKNKNVLAKQKVLDEVEAKIEEKLKG